jgi:hypothetical protein
MPALYCGNSDVLPPGYEDFGSRYSCLRKGFGVGSGVTTNKILNVIPEDDIRQRIQNIGLRRAQVQPQQPFQQPVVRQPFQQPFQQPVISSTRKYILVSLVGLVVIGLVGLQIYTLVKVFQLTNQMNSRKESFKLALMKQKKLQRREPSRRS